MKLEVIIPAYNEEEVIEACLQSLLNQTDNDFLATFIDDQSTDQTARIISEYQKKFPNQIRLRQWGKVGPGRARNRAAKESSADILVFMDADCEADSHWISALKEAFESSDFDSIGGPQLAHPSSNAFQKKLEDFYSRISCLISFYKEKKESDEIRETDHNPLCNAAYKRTAFLALKGFREDLFPGEDYELDYRWRKSDLRIGYNPKSIVYHHRPENSLTFSKVMFSYGRAQGKILREHGPHRLLHWLGLAFPFVCLGLIGGFAILGLLFQWSVLVVFSGLFLGLLMSALFFPPIRGPLELQIFLHSFQWFGGFWVGLWTNYTPVPGSQKPST